MARPKRSLLDILRGRSAPAPARPVAVTGVMLSPEKATRMRQAKAVRRAANKRARISRRRNRRS